MSFYGNIKRVKSSPFVFDRYFPSRKDMEEKLKGSDEVYVGRYVLIRYDCAYSKDNESHSINDLEFFTEWTDQLDEDGNKKRDPRFVQNCNDDLTLYHDTFNGTVWQKIYTNVNEDNAPQEKYIMVAELNADVPFIELNVISPKKLINKEDNIEIWNEPQFVEDGMSEEVFKLSMPDMLHLNVGDMSKDFYGKDLLNPVEKPNLPNITANNAFDEEHNYVKWINITYDRDQDGSIIYETDPNNPNKQIIKSSPSTDGKNIDEKQLDMKLFGFGQAISSMYDTLYGVPINGYGRRPFFTTENVITPENKGLIGILTSIGSEAKGDLTQDTYGRTLNNGMHYYFTSKWNSADEDSERFIENIPDVIGASSSAGGSSAYSQLYINFNADNGQYISDWN